MSKAAGWHYYLGTTSMNLICQDSRAACCKPILNFSLQSDSQWLSPTDFHVVSMGQDHSSSFHKATHSMWEREMRSNLLSPTLFGEFPGLSMAVTDLCPKSIYFFSNGICRDPCFNSSWLVLFCFVFLLPPQPSHLKNLFPAQHVSKWLEWWEVLDAPSFCACSRLLTFQFEVFLALNIHWPFLLLHLPK